MKKIQISKYGDPSVLELIDSEITPPKANEVLINVAAAGVNFIDTYQRAGLENYQIQLPFTPGLEGAGVVTQVGDLVLDFKPGDRVAWASALGSYAESVLIPQEKLVRVPAAIDLEIAAAAMLQGLTAHYLISDCFRITADHKVLIHAGAGGTGNLLCQLLIEKGALVIATTSSDAKAEIIRNTGVKHIIRYDKETVSERVKEITQGSGVDVVYDGVGRTTFDESLKSLRIRGTMVLFGAASGPVDLFDLQRLNTSGSLFITRPTLAHYIQTSEELRMRAREIFEFVEHKILEIKIFNRYPLALAPQAHQDLTSRNTSGKLLLVP